MWKWFWCLAALAIIDGVQTLLLLSDLGVRSEANPLMRLLITQFGFAGMWSIKLLALGFIALTMHRYSKSVMPILNVAMTVVVLVNTHHLQTVPEALLQSTQLVESDGWVLHQADSVDDLAINAVNLARD